MRRASATETSELFAKSAFAGSKFQVKGFSVANTRSVSARRGPWQLAPFGQQCGDGGATGARYSADMVNPFGIYIFTLFGFG